jgi:hypothetical protein
MGLRPLADDTDGMFLDVDCHYHVTLELKRTLLSHNRSAVFGVHPPHAEEVLLAATEALNLIVTSLERAHPGLVAQYASAGNRSSGGGGDGGDGGSNMRGGCVVNTSTGHYWDVATAAALPSPTTHPLEVAALLIQEDLAILLPAKEDASSTGCHEDGDDSTCMHSSTRHSTHNSATSSSTNTDPNPNPSHTTSPSTNRITSGTYVLAATVICFADQWVVPAKLGKTLFDVHEPVEHYPRTVLVICTMDSAINPGPCHSQASRALPTNGARCLDRNLS